ncbi:hypothetical protein LguiB_013273 [Lonicera macranthoides]
MMPRSSFFAGLIFALLILLILDESYTCTAKTEQCAPSSCGNISNIKYPFLRLKDDRRRCAEGEVIFELACEEDNRTTLSLPPGNNKYYVQNISYYSTFYATLQLVDAGLDAENYCSIPLGSFPLSKFRGQVIQHRGFHLYLDLFYHGLVYFMSCPIPIRFSKTIVNHSSCINNTSSASQTNHHFYTIVQAYNYSSPPDIPNSCNLGSIYPITEDLDYNNLSISYIHQKLLLGFEVSFFVFPPSRYVYICECIYMFILHSKDFYRYTMLDCTCGVPMSTKTLGKHSSQIYFPTWIYDRINQGEDMELGDATEELKRLVRKMTIVALWCIQLKPVDRPSMSKVLEMLEGEAELLQVPPKPTYCPPDDPIVDHGTTSSSSFLEISTTS